MDLSAVSTKDMLVEIIARHAKAVKIENGETTIVLNVVVDELENQEVE